MGLYINKGNTGFSSVCGKWYVDKTMLIDKVNSVLQTEYRFMCVTRARRFGKSVAIKMLNAYYDRSCDSSALFRNLRIASTANYKEHLNRYPVLYLDMTDFLTKYGNTPNLLSRIKEDIMQELSSLYKEIIIEASDDLMDMLTKIVAQTQQPFICLIDEWDALCREGDETLMDEYVNMLRRLFKGSNSELVFACVYMTGILPIKRYNTQSALNNFEEYTMLSPADLAPYFGFSQSEVDALCRLSQLDVSEMKHWYDGYEIGSEKVIYNPYAVIRALKRGRFESYWTSTNSFESLKQYLTMNFDGLKDDVIRLFADVPVEINHLKFSNDMNKIEGKDDVLTLLCHLGYLSYNTDTGRAKIPNFEVRQEFEMAISDSHWTEVYTALEESDALLEHVLQGDNAEVARCVERVHEQNTSILKYNDENALSCVLTLAFYTARKMYSMVRELPAGKGFADIVLLPYRNVDAPAIVLELKYNKSASSAIEQIKQQNYTGTLLHYTGDVILVAISYDKRTKKHSCLIERIEKSQGVLKELTVQKSRSTQGAHGPKVKEYSWSSKQRVIIDFCREPHTLEEIAQYLSVNDRYYLKRKHINPMLGKSLFMTEPDTPTNPHQKYYSQDV